MFTTYEIQRHRQLGESPEIRTVQELSLESRSPGLRLPSCSSPDERFETRSESFYIDRPRSDVWEALVDQSFWERAFGYDQLVMSFRAGASFVGSGRRGGFPFTESGEIIDLKKELALQFDVWNSLLHAENAPPHHHRITITLKDAWKGTRLSALETWHRPLDPDALLRRAWIDQIHRIGPLVTRQQDLSEENNYHV